MVQSPHICNITDTSTVAQVHPVRLLFLFFRHSHSETRPFLCTCLPNSVIICRGHHLLMLAVSQLLHIMCHVVHRGQILAKVVFLQAVRSMSRATFTESFFVSERLTMNPDTAKIILGPSSTSNNAIGFSGSLLDRGLPRIRAKIT